MHVEDGGQWTLTNVTLANNKAGIAGSSWLGVGSTCSLALVDCQLEGSNPSADATVVDFQCRGDFSLEGGHWHMAAVGGVSQVGQVLFVLRLALSPLPHP